MAIAFVEDFRGNQDFVNSTAITVAGGNVAVGSLAVIAVVGNADTATLSSVVDSKLNSWSVVSGAGGAVTGEGMALGMAYSVITTQLVSGSDTVTPTIGGADGLAAIIAHFTGLTTVSPLDKSTSTYTPLDVSHTSGNPGTTTEADELLVGGFVYTTAGGAFTSTGSFVKTTEGDYDPFTLGHLILQYRIVSATGGYASTGTTAASAGSRGGIMTFKGAPTAVAGVSNRFLIRTSRATSW